MFPEAQCSPWRFAAYAQALLAEDTHLDPELWQGVDGEALASVAVSGRLLKHNWAAQDKAGSSNEYVSQPQSTTATRLSKHTAPSN